MLSSQLRNVITARGALAAKHAKPVGLSHLQKGLMSTTSSQ